MVINAKYGQQVKSVYSGTVVFAEYLRGYGLVVLLDHGKGDMTLYGFNQALLQKEGDKVKAGEAIALTVTLVVKPAHHCTLKFAETAKLKIQRG